MAGLDLQKIEISGPTLASLIQRVSASPADADGLLFGHISAVTPSTLSDDSSPDPQTSTLFAAVTSFVCFGAPHSSSDTLSLVNSGHHTPRGTHLIGWFSGRRRSRLQPSMREFAATASLCNDPKLAFPVAGGGSESIRFSPRVFLIFSTPSTAPEAAAIHTHEYKAYQFCPATEEFEPKSVSVINIGPGFRGHYGNFSPNSPFPSLACDLRGSSMMQEDVENEKLNVMLQAAKDKKELDMLVEGFEIGSLRRLMGPEAAAYTAGLEDMYEKMLAKISSLAGQVEKSSVHVLELENQNSKMRADLAGIKRASDT